MNASHAFSVTVGEANLALLELAWQSADVAAMVPSVAERRLPRHVVDPSTARSIIMRNSTAFFAGVTTVFSATALGFAGAMMLTTVTPQSPSEHTKLDRSVASQAQGSSLADPKQITTTNASEPTQATTQAPVASAAAPDPQKAAPQVGTAPSMQVPASAQVQPAIPAQPKASGPEQLDASSQVKSASNAHARGTDEDIRNYVRKRERHWARRHYRDENATSAGQEAKSVDQNDRPPSLTSEDQAALQEQAQSAQIKTADQTATKVDDSDAGKVKRRHDRRWARGYSRDSGERGHDEARAPSYEVREMPRDDARPTFFGAPRWRPFFSDSDDD